MAHSEKNAILRSLWLAKAADYAIKGRAVLVGGTAVNLHTGSYRPTDIDMCALLDASDRQALVELGFTNSQDTRVDTVDRSEGGRRRNVE